MGPTEHPSGSPEGPTRVAKARPSGTEAYKATVYEIFWEYEVRPERVAAFEGLYGADGEWVRLFRQADGYVETLLFRDTDRPTRYLTVDRWRSRAEIGRAHV